MPHSILNPTDLHNPAPFGYSHTARIPAGMGLLFISGQYASRTDGTVISAVFGEQVQHAFRNLDIALAAYGLGLSDVVQLRSYVVNLGFDELGAITNAIQANWHADPPTQTVIGVNCLATPEILFEVEAVAAHR